LIFSAKGRPVSGGNFSLFQIMAKDSFNKGIITTRRRNKIVEGENK